MLNVGWRELGLRIALGALGGFGGEIGKPDALCPELGGRRQERGVVAGDPASDEVFERSGQNLVGMLPGGRDEIAGTILGIAEARRGEGAR